MAWNTLKNILTGSSGLTTNAGTASSALNTISAGSDVLTTNFSGVKATVDSVSGMASELSSGPYTVWKDSGAPSGVTSGAVAGQLYFDSASNKLWQYSGSVWVEISDLDNVGGLSDAALLKTVAKNRIAVNGSGSSWANPTAYQTVPDSSDASALNISFVKANGSSTKLIISVFGSILFTSGAGQQFAWGARVGSTTYDVATTYLGGPTTRFFWGGVTSVSGLSAGTYSIDPMMRSGGAAALTLVGGQDSVSISVTESPA